MYLIVRNITSQYIPLSIEGNIAMWLVNTIRYIMMWVHILVWMDGHTMDK